MPAVTLSTGRTLLPGHVQMAAYYPRGSVRSLVCISAIRNRCRAEEKRAGFPLCPNDRWCSPCTRQGCGPKCNRATRGRCSRVSITCCLSFLSQLFRFRKKQDYFQRKFNSRRSSSMKATQRDNTPRSNKNSKLTSSLVAQTLSNFRCRWITMQSKLHCLRIPFGNGRIVHMVSRRRVAKPERQLFKSEGTSCPNRFADSQPTLLIRNLVTLACVECDAGPTAIGESLSSVSA
jgi:hypothetical protein